MDAVLGAAIEGEELSLRAERQARLIAVSLDRPKALRGVGEQELLDPTFTASGASGLGTGFALRLVRGLVIVAGGRLDITADRFSLQLPAARG